MAWFDSRRRHHARVLDTVSTRRTGEKENTMRLALVCPRTGAFILVAVHMMAARDRGVNCVRPFVSVAAYDLPGEAVWSEADVARCERNERFFRKEDDARAFAASIARTLQTATSLGRLTLLQGEAYQTWHKAKFCVA